jgi:hypothetical protein
MITGAGKIRISKSDPTVRRTSKDVPRRRVAINAEEKSWLRIHVGVTPAIQNDSGDVPARIEAAGREHVAELLAEGALVLGERSAEQLRAPSAALFSYR